MFRRPAQRHKHVTRHVGKVSTRTDSRIPRFNSSASAGFHTIMTDLCGQAGK